VAWEDYRHCVGSANIRRPDAVITASSPSAVSCPEEFGVIYIYLFILFIYLKLSVYTYKTVGDSRHKHTNKHERE